MSSFSLALLDVPLTAYKILTEKLIKELESLVKELEPIQDVVQATQEARKALLEATSYFSRMSPDARVRLAKNLAERIKKHVDELVQKSQIYPTAITRLLILSALLAERETSGAGAADRSSS